MNHENIIISLADRINSHLKDAVERFDLAVFSSDSLYAGYRNKDGIQVEIFRIDFINHEVTVLTASKGVMSVMPIEKINQFIIDHVNL